MTFAPDHPSEHYSDGLSLAVPGEPEPRRIQLVGQAKAHICYLYGGDEILPEVESLMLLRPMHVPDDSRALHLSHVFTLSICFSHMCPYE